MLHSRTRLGPDGGRCSKSPRLAPLHRAQALRSLQLPGAPIFVRAGERFSGHKRVSKGTLRLHSRSVLSLDILRLCPSRVDPEMVPKASGKQQYQVCPEQYVSLACLTAAVVGVMQIAGSILKLGFLVSFLGHPVTSGFTSGAAKFVKLECAQSMLRGALRVFVFLRRASAVLEFSVFEVCQEGCDAEACRSAARVMLPRSHQGVASAIELVG